MKEISNNAKLAYSILENNLSEISDMIKRTGDRMIVVLGVTVTGYGLVMKLPVVQSTSAIGDFCFGISIFFLVATFLSAVIGLFPKQSEQPGSTDINVVWNRVVLPDPDVAYANCMNDLCKNIRIRREINKRMNRWFKLTIIFGGSALLTICVSTLLHNPISDIVDGLPPR